MSASEPRIVPLHELCGRTCSEERAATHLTLYGAAGAARAPCQVRVFEDSSVLQIPLFFKFPSSTNSSILQFPFSPSPISPNSFSY